MSFSAREQTKKRPLWSTLESRLMLKAESDVIFWGVFGNKKKATGSFDSIALVPHIGVEPMIYCVRGSCPGPLDECGSL